MEELRSHARGEIQLRTRIIEGPDRTTVIGRHIPIYLDERVQAYLVRRAGSKGIELSDLVNDLLKKEIEIIEAVATK